MILLDVPQMDVRMMTVLYLDNIFDFDEQIIRSEPTKLSGFRLLYTRSETRQLNSLILPFTPIIAEHERHRRDPMSREASENPVEAGPDFFLRQITTQQIIGFSHGSPNNNYIDTI